MEWQMVWQSGRLVRFGWFAALALASAAGASQAQDAVRGRRLFADTAKETGRNVAACASCHSDASALRAMLANRGVRVDEAGALARWLQSVIDGAQPGAANAKAQFRDVLTPQDVLDLAAYLAGAKAAARGRSEQIAATRGR
jgi:mono/diheme cytochrome c family protein